MQVNRVGLPRRFLAVLAADLSKCGGDVALACGSGSYSASASDVHSEAVAAVAGQKRKLPCNHGTEAEDCNKFAWTVLNKGEYELCVWQDAQLIVSYGNFFSGTRCGLLSRGSHHTDPNFRIPFGRRKVFGTTTCKAGARQTAMISCARSSP